MDRINFKKLAVKTIDIINSKKGEDTFLFDVRKITSFTDYLIITTLNSTTQMDAILKELRESLKQKPEHIEGNSSCGWMLIDYGSVIINLFTDEMRQFYNLERIWGEGVVNE